MRIFFDMDGTLNRFYEVDNWLEKLMAKDISPYVEARPNLNLSRLARLLHKLQRQGHEIGIASWLSKSGDLRYNMEVTEAKLEWLDYHMPSVSWDEIQIIGYGIDKWEVCRGDILFDDEEPNRSNWKGQAYKPEEIFEVLNRIVKGE